MQRIYVFTAMTVVLSAAVLLAQSDSDYQGWMKSNAANMDSLNKNIAAKDGAGAASDAQKIEATFKQVGEFWTKRGGADDARDIHHQDGHARAVLGRVGQAGVDRMAGKIEERVGLVHAGPSLRLGRAATNASMAFAPSRMPNSRSRNRSSRTDTRPRPDAAISRREVSSART